MSVKTDYDELGEIDDKAPLEELYEAMLPRLKNYGLTTGFPADKASLEYSINGIEFDVWIGEPPAAIRYIKYQESPYRNGGIELTLESEKLVHNETGEKLSLKIFITDYISGMNHRSGTLWLTIKFSGEESEIEALKKAIAPVLEKYKFHSVKAKVSPAANDTNEKFSAERIDNSNSNFMENNNVNFDELAQKAFAPGAGEADYERLFAAAFSLPEWYFIADAEFSYKMPYCAIFPDYFGEAVALTVFTDRERARKFIAEKGIKTNAADDENQNPNSPQTPEDLILRISTTGILDFFEKLAPLSVTKIFFNPNKDSHGFHHDLKVMRPIYEHLENKNLLGKTETITAVANNSDNLSKLLEENADVIADFERENETFSAIIAGSAASMDAASGEDKERIIANTADMFEGVRVQQNMSPKLFRVFIETCLEKRKFLMPVLAFAYFQREESGIKKLEHDKELSDELAQWFIKKAVPNADLLMNEPAKNLAAPADENIAEKNFLANGNGEKTSAESGVDFDELSKKAMTTNAMEDLNALFGATFALPKWHFISRGELPNVAPYVASNAAVADNQPMIRAFTDTDRLMRFARENNLTEADGSAKVLTMPTETIIPYLEGFISEGAFGVWFNSDSQSSDFFIPIKQLQPIKDHLAKLNPPAEKASEKEFTALLLTVTDGLSLPSGFVKQSSYNCNFFCWIPREWTEDLQLKNEYLEKLYEQFYGANWRSGNSDGSRYIVLESNSAVMSPERVKDTKWNVAQNNELNRYWYYIGNTDGTFRNVTAEEFQTNFDAYFHTEKTSEARRQQDNLANFGISETADGDFDLNLTINKVGTVSFETSIAPFYDAIVPFLEDYKGAGDYMTLLKFEESGKSGQVENIAENAHGAYLQIRRFLYLNPKNNTRIGVNSIHSKSLRHVRTNAELLISFELCKNLDNQTGVFYHAFQGPKSEILRLSAAIQPILEASGYQAVQ